VGEHLAENLCVLIAKASSVDVLTAVGKAFEVSGSNSRDPKLIKLVVLANSGERDSVVDFADLAEGCRRVLGDNRYAIGKLGCNE